MHKLKKVFAIFMTMAMMTTMFSSLIPQVAALDLSKTYEVSGDYTLNDENGNVFEYYIGLRKEDNPYGYAVNEMRRTIHDYTVKRKGLIDRTYNTDYLYAFCIEMGIPIKDKMEYTGSSNANHGNKWAAMSPQQRDLIMLALSYGYTN